MKRAQVSELHGKGAGTNKRNGVVGFNKGENLTVYDDGEGKVVLNLATCKGLLNLSTLKVSAVYNLALYFYENDQLVDWVGIRKLTPEECEDTLRKIFNSTYDEIVELADTWS